MARVWFVTGASRGLGRSIVEAVLKSGDFAVATARKSELLNDLVEQYGSDNVLAVDLDVTDYNQAVRAVDLANQKFGRIDILVNNAGYAAASAVEDADMEVFKKQIDANFYGVVNVTRAVLPTMRGQRSGHIMQLSSIGGRAGAPGLSAYTSAKWALTGFSTSLSREVAPFSIKVTVLEPGGIKTAMVETFSDTEGISEPYRGTVKAAFQGVLGNASIWSAPAEIAEAIVRVSKIDNPPLRLLLGRDTVGAGKGISAALAASDEQWQHLTLLSPEVSS